jgi:hypothetical protein
MIDTPLNNCPFCKNTLSRMIKDPRIRRRCSRCHKESFGLQFGLCLDCRKIISEIKRVMYEGNML